MTYYRENNWLKPKTLVTTHTTQQTSPINGGVQSIVAGLDISYEPATGASNVVVEASFYGEKAGRCDVQFMPRSYDSTSSTWSDINERYIRNISNTGNSQKYRWLNRLQFALPAWTGEKRIAIWVGSHAGGRSMDLHLVPQFDGASSSTTFFSTHMIVYSV